MQTDTAQQWSKAKAEVFWGEIAPCEHVVQIYENDLQAIRSSLLQPPIILPHWNQD
jgi:hypothetical protein